MKTDAAARKLILPLVFLLAAVCFSRAWAESEAEFTVESASIPLGGTGVVTVKLSANPGVAGFTGALLYDREKLTIVQTEVHEFSDMVFALNPDSGRFGGLSLGGDSAATGVLFRVTFQAKAETAPGETEVAVRLDQCGNCRRNTVPTKVNAGIVTIAEKEDRLPGDVNGDGTVDGRDLLRFARYLAGNDAAINQAASDVNGDGTVDGRDVLRLARYLAGQDAALK